MVILCLKSVVCVLILVGYISELYNAVLYSIRSICCRFSSTGVVQVFCSSGGMGGTRDKLCNREVVSGSVQVTEKTSYENSETLTHWIRGKH